MTETEQTNPKYNSLIPDHGNVKSFIGEDDFVSLSKNGITINFHLKNRHLDLENIFRTVRRVQKIVNDLLGHNLEKIDIDINDSVYEMRQEGRSRSRYASWIGGIFDDRIRVIAERDDYEPESLHILLTHEIIHLAVYEMSNGECPSWLDEGLAVSLSQELPNEYLEKLAEAARNDAILPLDVLESPLPPNVDDALRQVGYAQCASLVEYLVKTHGWETVQSFVLESAVRPIKLVLADKCLNNSLLELSWKRWFLSRFA